MTENIHSYIKSGGGNWIIKYGKTFDGKQRLSIEEQRDKVLANEAGDVCILWNIMRILIEKMEILN